MLATIRSFGLTGLDAVPITVEVDSARGLPGMTIVGLPDKAVEEAKERVRSAIVNTEAVFPMQRLTVNLAPADVKKVGPAYDLPIALGILGSDRQLEKLSSESAFVGELALDGSIRPIDGVLSIALAAVQAGIAELYVPKDNAEEAAAVSTLTVYGVESLREVSDHLLGRRSLTPTPMPVFDALGDELSDDRVDLADIQGQEQAKRALEIAAAGGHNILFSGPPGAGKTLLARALPGILPPLQVEEVLEVTRIHSVAGQVTGRRGLQRHRPFRAPHHTASGVALIGGGTWPRPGEISLAHHGVLFLDELPEFPRSVLEVLRQPLEEGSITISRAAHVISFPARFLLVAAQNPCPCGRLGSGQCVCTSTQVRRYQQKVSGPLKDRIDLHIEVPAVKFQQLRSNQQQEKSELVQQRVVKARQIQHERYHSPTTLNAHVKGVTLKQWCVLDTESEGLLEQAVRHFNLSARGYHKTLKVARTIADLADLPSIQASHIAEALQYRTTDASRS